MPGAKYTPDELVEAEIARLSALDTVKLARKEQRLINARRNYMALLRNLDKRGQKLMADGWTYDTIDLLYQEFPSDKAEKEE